MFRRRTFGGAGGLWLRKKRPKDTTGAVVVGAAAASSSSALVAAPPLQLPPSSPSSSEGPSSPSSVPSVVDKWGGAPTIGSVGSGAENGEQGPPRPSFLELDKANNRPSAACRPHSYEGSTASSSSPSSDDEREEERQLDNDDLHFGNGLDCSTGIRGGVRSNNSKEEDERKLQSARTKASDISTASPSSSVLSKETSNIVTGGAAAASPPAADLVPLSAARPSVLWIEEGKKTKKGDAGDAPADADGATTAAIGAGRKRRGAFGSRRRVTTLDETPDVAGELTPQQNGNDDSGASVSTSKRLRIDGDEEGNNDEAAGVVAGTTPHQPPTWRSILKRPKGDGHQPVSAAVTSTTTTAASSGGDLTDFEFHGDDDEEGSENRHPAKTPAAVVHQPSALTSLSVARKFFEKLDSDDQHQLAVDDRLTPQMSAGGGRATRNGRTFRVLDLSNPVVADEYRQYAHACAAADVEPLKLESFLHQRRLFHADAVYDGILDD